MKNRLGKIDNSRTAAQRQHMQETVEQNVCPFCVIDRNINHPLWEEDFHLWWVWASPWRYPGHARQFIIVLRRHEERYERLTVEEIIERYRIEQRLIAVFAPLGYGLVTRGGDLEWNAGTLSHLHSHFQIPDGRSSAIAVFFKDDRLQRFLRATNPEGGGFEFE